MADVTADVFELGAEHEQVVFCNDAATGLKAIVAIHSTALGPALGGTRFYPYPSTADAVQDVLNLSRGMSYKASLAGLDLGSEIRGKQRLFERQAKKVRRTGRPDVEVTLAWRPEEIGRGWIGGIRNGHIDSPARDGARLQGRALLCLA